MGRHSVSSHLPLETLTQLARIVLRHDPVLTFTMIEIGARPVTDEPEPFHPLIDLSRIQGTCFRSRQGALRALE
jgi:hypothetical protein